ncbi:hypothetical protein KR222_011482 [Zaprionus bogoriensis]|nr:hypothetical protein KR222_011482 [Zaprionus bogoriensis]
MNSQMPADRLQQLREQFLQHDQRGDAKIGYSQLGDCLRVVGANPSEASIRDHIQSLRERHVERISFDDFLAIYDSVQSENAAVTGDPAVIAEQFIDCLRHFDEQNTGYIPAGRLRHILTNCGERLTVEEVDQLLNDCVNDHGLVNYAEFVNMILNS